MRKRRDSEEYNTYKKREGARFWSMSLRRYIQRDQLCIDFYSFFFNELIIS